MESFIEHITLKFGDEVIIRTPKLSEAKKLNDLKCAYIDNTMTLPWTLEEFSRDEEKEKKVIKTYQSSINSVLLVAEFKDELIGNIDITGSERTKMFHTAMLGMGIDESWRNQGLGKALIKSAIKWAEMSSPIEIIWLDLYATNELGFNLYKNTGFEMSGVIKDFFKQEDGYIDKIQMYQRIK